MTRRDAPPSDITVTLRCNNRCVFCAGPTLRHLQLGDLSELRSRLEQIRAHGERVVLTGGEVTILPDPPGLVALCRELGFSQIALITNGRMLARPGLAEALVDAGLTEVCVSVYDLRDEVHDALTREPGSLRETLAGLERMLALAAGGADLAVRVGTVVCAANHDGVAPLLRRMAPQGVRGFLLFDVVLSARYDEPLEHARVTALARELAADPLLASCDLLWRGFPLCLLHGLPGVFAEPHDVDTTVVEDDKLQAYFDEFHANFVRAEACGACTEAQRCHGLQRRYRDRHGDGHLRPIQATAAELARFGPERDPGRLALTPTTACQLRCDYCLVELGRRHAEPEVLDRAVDLLLSSDRDELELQFFGGEPLLRRAEVERTMQRAQRLAGERGKRVRFTITTNGLLLDESFLAFLQRFESRVLFSMDGDPEVQARHRPPGGRGDAAEAAAAVERSLAALVRSGVPYFVNVVVTADAAGELPRRVAYLVEQGVETVQCCYAMGPGWDAVAGELFCDGLRRTAALADGLARQGRQLRIQNLGSRAEPTVLSNDLLVDVDGTLYSDAALFCEKALPGLRGPYRLGSVLELEAFDGLRRTRAENLAILRETYPEGDPVREVLEQQLALGRAVQRTLDELAARPRRRAVRDRNPLLQTVIQRSVPEQAALMRKLPGVLKLPLLLLENPCAYDCIFCRAKPLPPSPLDEVRRWLAGNRQAGLTRLGLVGNEPLLHPELDAILEAARAEGFVEFQALTTAAPLADPDRCRALVEAGVTSLALPLYAADPAIHDSITRAPGSHAHTLRALENLAELGAEVFVHANLMRQNLDDAAALQALVEGELGLSLCFVPVRPKDANRPYEELAPRYDEIVERAGIHGLVAFPLCLAAQLQDPAIADAAIVADVLKVYLLDQPFVKPPRCDGCALRDRCTGTFQAYLDLHGDGELRPRS